MSGAWGMHITPLSLTATGRGFTWHPFLVGILCLQLDAEFASQFLVVSAEFPWVFRVRMNFVLGSLAVVLLKIFHQKCGSHQVVGCQSGWVGFDCWIAGACVTLQECVDYCTCLLVRGVVGCQVLAKRVCEI